MRSLFAFACVFLSASSVYGQGVVADFQDLSLPGPNSAYYGQDNAGGFTSRMIVPSATPLVA